MFDWQCINYFKKKYLDRNPFGFPARRIGDLYCGMKNGAPKNYECKQKYRNTKHTHNPVDAKGNTEALLAMRTLGLHIHF